MHDIAALEGRGVAAVYVASTEFLEAAITQARALGVEESGVYVSHPIQDRTDQEMRALADVVVNGIWAELTAQS